eukprot:CAMPEP_0201605928 /NCGR_PEP_ID=MMETSP0492-20130828/5567_1 /ASSEMBLY_ACC=CAM_ASM_000837 /TAXON_ID=420259 /ORGANISM="Thalassiosira gravida, Strain GMp14c1" /LENGTH=222 /DNA_ID=CAMNT_0048070251 /DNA_START=80 /DNA_END=748 /DNA_ORIENTATION=-
MTNSLPPLAMVASSKPSTLSKYSASLPFLRRPQHLTQQYAGDVGFDPLDFAKTPEKLEYYREAEVKHARIAMLAAAGWPVSELFDAKITAAVNDADFGLSLSPLVDGSDRAPSLLNGGLDHVSPYFWGFCLGLTAAIDLKGIRNSRYGGDDDDGDYLPGDYGFDPLRVYPSEKEGRERMQLAEIKHGRLAMLAVVGFATQEFVSQVGVVDETPAFFNPLFHF